MNELFAITEYCTVHNIDPSFVYSLQQEGLIAITTRQEENFIEEEELHKLEVFTRWHSQLGLHPESMEIVANLLEKVKQMHEEMEDLRTRLNIFKK
jgi:MerR family transcriptional regulator, heat shock protein HspR